MPVRRSTSTVFFLPRRPIENLSPRLSTGFHSRVPKREKNFMDSFPGWIFMPGVPLTPGLLGVPFTPGTPGTPFTNPSHLPTQIPQSWLPLIRMALSPTISSMVQHFSGLFTCSIAGRTSPRIRCAVLTTRPAWSITSTEENCSWAECITRQVNASCLSLSNNQCTDDAHGAEDWAKDSGDNISVGSLKIWAGCCTALKFFFGFTVKWYLSSSGGSARVVNRIMTFSAIANSWVTGWGSTALLYGSLPTRQLRNW